MTDSSSSPLRESISALVDGEQNDMDLQRILNSMRDDPASEARLVWHRYQLVRHVMKGEQGFDLSIDLSESIRQTLATESPGGSAQVGKKISVLWSGMAKTAVAASVMLGVLFGVQQLTLDAGQPVSGSVAVDASATQPEITAQTGAVVPDGFQLPPLSARTVSTNPLVPARQQVFSQSADVSRNTFSDVPQNVIILNDAQFQEQINRLMHKHAQDAASAGSLGTLPYARVSEAGGEVKE